MSHLVPAPQPLHRANTSNGSLQRVPAPAPAPTAHLPSVAQLTRRHTAPVFTSPERLPRAPNPNRGHFQPYPSHSAHSSPPSSPQTPARPSTSRATSTAADNGTGKQLMFPIQPTEADPDAEILHPPYPPKLNYVGIVSAKNPSKFLHDKDFVDSKGNVIQEYPYKFEPVRGVGGLKPGPIEDTECLRCTFCRKKYRGKNAKSMWRRHVQKSHKIKLQNYRERNKENEMDEEITTPARPKITAYPKLSTGAKPTHMVVMSPARMPLMHAVVNNNITPEAFLAAAASAQAAATAGNKVKFVVKAVKDEPVKKVLPKAPKVDQRVQQPRWPTTTRSSQPEPQFTLDSSDDDDTETLKIPCPHAEDDEQPCQPCVDQFKGLKKGLRRTASMMTLLSPVDSLALKDSAHTELPFFAPPPPPALNYETELATSPPSSPGFAFADVEMSQDPDSSQDDILPGGSQLSFLSESEDEWNYDPGSESELVLEPSMASSPRMFGLGFGGVLFEPPTITFDITDASDDVSPSPVDFMESDEWLQWDDAALVSVA